VVDNEHYGETGMQATHTRRRRSAAMARAGFRASGTIYNAAQWKRWLPKLHRQPGPVFASIKVTTQDAPRCRRCAMAPPSRIVSGKPCWAAGLRIGVARHSAIAIGYDVVYGLRRRRVDALKTGMTEGSHGLLGPPGSSRSAGKVGSGGIDKPEVKGWVGFGSESRRVVERRRP
jgi:hypothetical protein